MSTYGHIDSEEMVLKKFYACQPTQDECVIAFTAKLEEPFVHAVEIKAVDTLSNQTILKTWEFSFKGWNSQLNRCQHTNLTQ